jgi:hypothetical protein
VFSATAGPAPNVPLALGAFTSLGGPQMLSPALAVRVKGALAAISPDDPARAAAADTFAGVVSGTFTGLLLTSLVVNLQGAGPVPGYKASGSGPVSGGSCTGTNIVQLKP